MGHIATKPVFGVSDSDIQTSLLSYRDYPKNLNFAGGKYRYDTFQLTNNKGANQTAQMCRLVSAFVVGKPPKTGFLPRGPNRR